MHRINITLSRSPASVRLRPPGVSKPPPAPKPPAPDPAVLEAARQQQQLQQLQARNAQLQQLMETLQFELQELEGRRRQSLLELQQIAVELAVVAAEHVVRKQIDQQQHDVAALVAQAIDLLPLKDPAVVRANPADVALLQQQSSVPWAEGMIQLQPDESLPPGGLRLDSESGRIVMTDVNTRLEQIRRKWMENINDTHVERRQVSPDAEKVRRFPDRRETA